MPGSGANRDVPTGQPVGSTARTVVPPAPEWTSSRPPATAARSAIPRSPRPPGSAPPGPSSQTSTTRNWLLASGSDDDRRTRCMLECVRHGLRRHPPGRLGDARGGVERCGCLDLSHPVAHRAQGLPERAPTQRVHPGHQPGELATNTLELRVGRAGLVQQALDHVEPVHHRPGQSPGHPLPFLVRRHREPAARVIQQVRLSSLSRRSARQWR